MQMKLLNVALATALATVLTGCGSSDGDAKYNNQMTTPIKLGSGISSTELESLKSELADAKEKGTATEKRLKELEELIAQYSGNTDGTTGNTDGTTGNTDGTTGNTGGTTGSTDGTGTATPVSPALPPVKDKENAAGNASTTEDVKAVDATGLQNYVRGDIAVFDNEFNPKPENTGNPTVVNSETIDNKVLSNIVLARPTVERTVRQVYAGENPHDAGFYSFNESNREGELNLLNGSLESLQNNNISIVTYNHNDTNDTNDVSYSPKGEQALFGKDAYIFIDNAKDTKKNRDLIETAVAEIKYKDGVKKTAMVAKQPYVLQRDYIGKSLDKTLHGIYKNAVENKSKPTNLTNNAELKKLSADAYKNGLVRTFSIGQVNGSETKEYLNDVSKSKDRAIFIVRGQEREVIKLDTEDKKPGIIHKTGAKDIKGNEKPVANAKNNTRIFGTLSQNLDGSIYKGDDGSVGDIPSHVWDPVAGEDKNGAFVPNGDDYKYYKKSKEKYSLSKGTPNSYQFTASKANQARNEIVEIYNEKNSLFKDSTGNTNDATNNSEAEGSGYNNALFRAGLTPTPIHLDHVQYGRVSVEADNATMKGLSKKLKDGADVVRIAFVGEHTNGHKFTYDPNKTLSNKVNKNSNLDTYFARGLQETKDMPEKGEVTYLGHALTYGLDNSYHGDDQYISNSIVGTQREGIGNFVRAKADFAKGTVEGNIYNVWTKVGGNDNENLKTSVEEDNLVGFKGDITANHNSVLGESWLEYGNKDKGTFKGAFFGKGASELGGSVNSVKEGYDKAEWGGVFGAKALEGKEKLVSFTAHTENAKNEQNP